MSRIKVTKEESAVRADELKKRGGNWILLGRPLEANAWRGHVEHSFSMGWSPDTVRVWWTGHATSNLGTRHVIGGAADVQRHVERARMDHRDWELAAFELGDPACPVDIEWDRWARGMLSGNKDSARNARFSPRDTQAGAAPAAVGGL